MPVFYDKELDYGSRYYLFITVVHVSIAEGREAGRWLKGYGVYCLRPEGRGPRDAKEWGAWISW